MFGFFVFFFKEKGVFRNVGHDCFGFHFSKRRFTGIGLTQAWNSKQMQADLCESEDSETRSPKKKKIKYNRYSFTTDTLTIVILKLEGSVFHQHLIQVATSNPTCAFREQL